MNLKALKKVVVDVANGGWENYSTVFNNDITLLLKIADKHGLLGLIKPFARELESHENAILYYLVETYPDVWIPYICDNIINTDLVKKDDGYYLKLSELSDLSVFFRDSDRYNLSAADMVKNVFSEESYEPFDSTTDNVYNDVVDDLTPENLGLLKKALFEELNGTTISTETEYLNELDIDDAGEVMVNNENFPGMFEDSETLEYMVNDAADGVHDKLYGIHWNCTNSAYTDEAYDRARRELDEFFIGDYVWETRQTSKGTTQHFPLIKIKDIAGNIKQFLFALRKSQYSDDTLSYIGSYSGMIKEGMNQEIWEFLDFNIPDYADWSRVKKCINEYFKEEF